MGRKILLSLLVSILMVSLAAAACAAPAAPKQLKIGAIEPLTGFPVGVSWGKGFELFFDKVNEQGGVKIGKEQYLIDYILEDSQFNPEAAITAAKKLVYQDKVKFVLGPILDFCVDAVYQVCAPNEVLHFGMVNVPESPGEVSPDKSLYARPFPGFFIESLLTVDLDAMAETYPNVKSIALAGPEMGYDPWIENAKSWARDHGVKVTSADIFPLDTVDFIPVFTRVLANNPDAVLLLPAGTNAQEVRAVRELEFEGPVLSASVLGPDVIIAVAGPEASTDVICNGPDIEHPTEAMQEVMERWEAKYEEPFISDSLMAWDGAWVLIQAMEKAKSIDPEEVLATLETMTKPGSIQTVFGDAYMGGFDRFGVNRVLVRPIPIVRLMNGKMELMRYVLPE